MSEQSTGWRRDLAAMDTSSLAGTLLLWLNGDEEELGVNLEAGGHPPAEESGDDRS